MYRDGINWEKLDATLDEILNDTILSMWEDSDWYYIRPKPSSYYDNRMYQIEKKTENVYHYMIPVFISYQENNTTPINIDKFLSERKRHSA